MCVGLVVIENDINKPHKAAVLSTATASKNGGGIDSASGSPMTRGICKMLIALERGERALWVLGPVELVNISKIFIKRQLWVCTDYLRGRAYSMVYW